MYSNLLFINNQCTNLDCSFFCQCGGKVFSGIGQNVFLRPVIIASFGKSVASMFQTEPNHFLQTLDHPVIFWLMNGITYLGYNSAYVAALIILFFSVSLKRSFIIMHMLIWTALVTSLLKDFFALPRPENVDASLRKLISEFTAHSPFVRQGAQHFFGLPAAEAIDYYRANQLDSFGFPSGHVSGTTAFWGGIALFIQQNWLRIIGLLVIVLMPLSRMYLGRHFLADVLGGLALGAFTVLAAWFFLVKREKLTSYINKPKLTLAVSLPTLLFVFFCIGLPVFFIAAGNTVASQFLGLNLAFLLVGLQGFPSDEGTVVVRILRSVLAIAVLVGSSIALDQLMKAAGLYDYESLVLVKRGLEMFLLIWGTTAIAKKIGWYKDPAQAS